MTPTILLFRKNSKKTEIPENVDDDDALDMFGGRTDRQINILTDTLLYR